MYSYTYDFNYSINFDALPKPLPPALATDEEREFMLTANQFVESAPCKSKDIQQFAGLLVKQSIFIRIGNLATELGEIQLELVAKNLKSIERLEQVREELCECIRELNILLSRDKEFYINVIVLFLSIILARLLAKRHLVDIDRQVLFHLLHWEIKGQHSTNSFLETVSKELLHADSITRFLTGKSNVSQPDVMKSLTFRQVQTSIQFKKEGQGHMMSSFAQAFNKENQQMNLQFKPSLKNFKKQPLGAGEQGNARMAPTFSNCLKK